MFTNGPIFALPVFYLDPGSGSFIIQLLLGAGLGLMVGAKLYWAKLRSFFSRNKMETPQAPEDTDEIER